MGRNIIYLLCLIFPCYAFAQQVKPLADYAKADTLAMHIKYNGDVNKLTHQLTDPFSDETLKARAIYRWITDNIDYDCKYFNRYGYKGRGPKTYKCSDNDDSLACDIKRRVWENTYVDHVLDARKGVCEGYSLLFKRMCNIAGIACEYVSGYIRTEYYEVGTPGNLDHAWNAVNLHGTWYLLDATWAAGGSSRDDNGKMLKFFKDYEEYYWLTPPEDFARNHFPEDPKWVLVKNYTKEKFSTNPFYDLNYVTDIKLLAPASGILHLKYGDTVKFKVIYTGEGIGNIQINTSAYNNPEIWYDDYITRHKYIKKLDTIALKKQQYIKYKRTGETYEFAYAVKDYTLDYIDVLFDYRRVMRFKVTYR